MRRGGGGEERERESVRERGLGRCMEEGETNRNKGYAVT